MKTRAMQRRAGRVRMRDCIHPAGDGVIFHLLTQTSIFVPLGNGAYFQVRARTGSAARWMLMPANSWRGLQRGPPRLPLREAVTAWLIPALDH